MLTDPGVVLGLMVTVRFVDEESDDLGVGEAGRETPTLLEGARPEADVVDVRLRIEVIPDDVRLGAETVGVRLEAVREDVRLELVREGVRLGLVVDDVRLGGLTVTDRLGAAELRVVRVDGALELGRLDGRESDLETLRVETGEGAEADETVVAGVGVLDEVSTRCF